MAGAAAEPFVDAKLKQRPVMLFSKKNSPQCKEIRKMLDEYKMPPSVYEVCEIERRQDCTQIENYFQIICLSDTREVPQLFVKGHHVGGPVEIPRLHTSGKLKMVFSEAGIEVK